ncbi:MAG TPA: toll/interleukin-1 receptor domain-containing protein [Blastocatellia bacterium]|nr:toll/interleukin-1 receptor domain-containing protein [Blastocatellia bacterium]
MKVFISYASKDEALARKLTASLEDAGLDAWYDKREILPGDNWAEKISQGLKESNAMVVLLTPQALQSDAVQNNISYALGQEAFRNRLIPVIIGDANDFPADSMPWIFKRLQTITVLKDDEEAEQFKKVAEAIKAAA